VVANICVYAAQDQNNPVAIIVPAEAALRKLAESNGIKETEHEKLIRDPKVNSLVFNQMQAIGKRAGLASFEMIAGVVMAEEEWTPENGFTTAATKIQRKKILEKYQKDIDRAYGKK
jgi:long-chain acyl-CoA synthetase